MSFNNIPPNGFPALPDIEDLEAVEKDVTTIANELDTLRRGLTDVTDVTANVNSDLIDNPSLAVINAKKMGKMLFVNAYIYPSNTDGVDVVANTIIFTLTGVAPLTEVFCSSNSSNGSPARLKLNTNGLIKNETVLKNHEWYSMSFVGLID